MNTLTVELAERSYPIYIDSGLLEARDLFSRHITGKNLLIVTDDNTASHYLPRLTGTLQGYKCRNIILPAGEANKNLDTVNLIYDVLMNERFDRNCTLVALGGGVVGDICGFAAATYQRGVRFVQVPTTLLAQVDSSVGGKTGVNHPLGKNMIGAFHQPACVIADMNTLSTLSTRELRAGLAEVIKYSLIDDRDFFDFLSENMTEVLDLHPGKLAYIVDRCCRNKARIVAADEREKGQRALLNLGHTFGHAIETACGYGVMLHGEAISTGMCLAARFSSQLGLLNETDLKKIEQTLVAAGLPVTPPAAMTGNQCHELMGRDKKVRDDILTLVLLKGIGRAFLSTDYDRALLASSLETAFTPG